MNRFDISLALSKPAAEALNELAPFPLLAPAVHALCGIIEICAQVSENRYAACQLRDRCHVVLLTLHGMGSGQSAEAMQPALDRATTILISTQHKLNALSGKQRFNHFLHLSEMGEEIRQCHVDLSDCVIEFGLNPEDKIHDWQLEFKENCKLDHTEVIAFLSAIDNKHALATDILQETRGLAAENRQMLRSVMSLMQKAQDPSSAGKYHSSGLRDNLYELQRQGGLLLPELNLKRGEVQRMGLYPVYGTPSMDVWEGFYLNQEKVAIKVLRSVNSSSSKHLKRFEREAKIWSKLWAVDKGHYLQPFYGYCQNDGPYPYVVSPWQSNGTAIDYVKSSMNRNISYRQLIRGIAQGIFVLHNMTIIHGDLKGRNIVINRYGEPLLADFGMTRLIEDITGTPVSQSAGVADSYRWMAPELCVGDDERSTFSDIYSFGMVALELITHQQPYANVKQHTVAVSRAVSGERPDRPTDLPASRGFDEGMWGLMQACWEMVPTDRPTIELIVGGMSAV